jgi:hypothetical protein
MLGRAFAVMWVRRLLRSVVVIGVPVLVRPVVLVVVSAELVIVVVIVIVIVEVGDDAVGGVDVIVAMTDAVRKRRNDHAKHENQQPCQTLAGAGATTRRQRAQLGLPA